MRRAAALAIALGLIALLAHGARAQDMSTAAQNLTLALPHPLGAGESAFIEVQLGAISRGRVVTITTAAGQPLGTVAPFGASHSAQGSGGYTYTLPLPAAAIRDGRVDIRVTISQPGGAPRAPTAEEVRSVKVGVGAPSR
jgi:hypothetical protein